MAAEAAPLIDQVENGGDASDASETSSLMGREVESGILARKVGANVSFLVFYVLELFSFLCKFLILQSLSYKCSFLFQILAIMGFLGFANVYAMRVNLSVAIVAMVNNTAIARNTSIVDNSSCPVHCV